MSCFDVERFGKDVDQLYTIAFWVLIFALTENGVDKIFVFACGLSRNRFSIIYDWHGSWIFDDNVDEWHLIVREFALCRIYKYLIYKLIDCRNEANLFVDHFPVLRDPHLFFFLLQRAKILLRLHQDMLSVYLGFSSCFHVDSSRRLTYLSC